MKTGSKSGAKRPAADEVARVRSAVSRRLLPWFRRHGRDLPWRRRRTAYRVLVSELMLQQTRVDQALPYYRRFLRRFPSLRALARADRQAVLKHWEGLGYYARARHLHELARRLTRERGGRFPRTVEGLRALPGVGDYTAAAVASLAFGVPAAVVDGNVGRVLSRIFCLRRPVRDPAARRTLATLAGALLLPGRAAACNEAWMELGALCCRPRRPRCGGCPMRAVCGAFRHGDPERWPARAPRRARPHLVVGAAVVAGARGRVLIARRAEGEMLGGLWEFPGGKREEGETLPECIARELREELGIRVSVGEPLVVVHHGYTHFTIELHAYHARLRAGRPRRLDCADYAWVAPEELDAYPFSRADRYIVEALRMRNAEGGPRTAE